LHLVFFASSLIDNRRQQIAAVLMTFVGATTDKDACGDCKTCQAKKAKVARLRMQLKNLGCGS
jgi:hypothetical protein